MVSANLQQFAAEPVIHITPTPVFELFGIQFTNSMFYGLLCAALTVGVLIYTAKAMTLRPRGGFIQFIEIGTDFITDLLKSSLGSEKKATRYAPWFVSIFFFIVFSNWLGLMPGVGEAFTSEENPLFRPFTADLNGTLAAAVVTWVLVQYFTLQEIGFRKHIRHYFNGSLKNPITIMLGFFEMFSDVARIASLALRLFLNVAIGEIIIAVFSSLGGLAGPITALPFTILELFVGALQAYIFVMLSVMYLAVAVNHAEHDESDEPLTLDEVVEREVGASAQ